MLPTEREGVNETSLFHVEQGGQIPTGAGSLGGWVVASSRRHHHTTSRRYNPGRPCGVTRSSATGQSLRGRPASDRRWAPPGSHSAPPARKNNKTRRIRRLGT